MATIATLAAGVAGWFAILIWAAWRGRWVSGGVGGMLLAIVLVMASRRLWGVRPLEYGLLLGGSLFLGTALVLIGLAGAVLRLLFRDRD